MMSRNIDLMPTEFRSRAEAGQRVRRTVGLCLMVAALAAGSATWSRLRADASESSLVRLEAIAQQAIDLETQAMACREAASSIELAIQDYHEVSLPMPVSALVAGVAESLPEGSTLESFSIHVDDGSRFGAPKDAKNRRLLGAVEGFAATDEDVALLARRLSSRSPLQHVRLEASSSRMVRGRPARGYTILFEVDLGRQFAIREFNRLSHDEAMARGLESAP